MKPLDKGLYYYLPILQRSINKTIAHIKRFMHKIDAQQITIPNLTTTELWKHSGNYRGVIDRKKKKYKMCFVMNDTEKIMSF